MPRQPAPPPRQCPCGRTVQRSSPHDRCSECRHRKSHLPRRRRSPEKGTSQLFPGHQDRMAKYEARAAAGLPLFT